MASFNVSLDDSSPLLSYAPAGAWTDTPDGDSQVQSYQGYSLHASSAKDSTATLKFNGTGVWFYGGKRNNYGTYSLTVDGKVVSGGSAQASSSSAQQLLVGAGSLGFGEHTAVLTNTGTGTVDVDSVVFETQAGTTSGAVGYAIIEDGTANVTYTGTGWGYSADPIFSNNGTHFTGSNADASTVSFYGDAVAVYGGSSFDHGDYYITLDNSTQKFSGNSNGALRMYHPQTLLYFATALGNGSHTLTITNGASGNATFLDVDKIGVYISPSYNSTNTTSALDGSGAMANLHVNQANASSAGAASSTSIESKGLSQAVIAAIVAVSVLVVLIIIALIVFLRKRSQRIKKVEKKNMLPSPVLPIQDDPEKGLPLDRALSPRKLEDRSSGVASATFYAFPAQPDLNRKLTTRTVASNWSQSSSDSSETLHGSMAFPSPKVDNMPIPPPPPTVSGPPMPELPPVTPLNINRANATPIPSPAAPPLPTPPVIPMPSGLEGRERSGSVSSYSSESTRSPGSEDEDFSAYYRDSVAPAKHQQLLDEANQRSTTPTRPHRPHGLTLHGSDFQSVQL